MRIASLDIRNFKAIRHFRAEDLGQMVVIAGPNGAGKTCVLDALRLLKVRLGSYNAQDLQSWLGEFQISPDSKTGDRALFRNPDLPFTIRATIEVTSAELEYVHAHAAELHTARAWQELLNNPELAHQPAEGLAVQFPHLVPHVEQRVAQHVALLRHHTDPGPYAISLTQSLNGSPVIEGNPVIESVFKSYRPQHLGTVEYFGASRSYQREMIGGVHIGEPPRYDPRGGQGVVNWQQKLANVKTELASSYVRSLIRGQASGSPEVSSLDATLKDLFATFFPDKEYLGVVPTHDGTLSFPVRLRSGEVHDINELSSGEKEIVYGYLRLRSAELKRSIILLDEPELHLNPALLHGLPDFYNRNLVEPPDNQMWLVTHSDAILRQAALNESYSVVHLQPATLSSPEANQAQPVDSSDAVERVLIDLVGDLALYQPRGKVVIFEGGGNTEFDAEMTRRLFPDVAKVANLVSGGSKRRVRDLYEVLNRASEAGALSTTFYAVVDRDSDKAPATPGIRNLQSWDRYHIENYLLEPSYVARVVRDNDLTSRMTPDEAMVKLQECAAALLSDLVSERLATEINANLIACLRIQPDRTARTAGGRFQPSIQAAFSQLATMEAELKNPEKLEARAAALEQTLREALANGDWVREFRGRDVLKRFVGDTMRGKTTYEGFRNSVISRMADDGYQPEGMARVLLDNFELRSETPPAAVDPTATTSQGDPGEAVTVDV